MATVIFQRPTKPKLETVTASIRKDTGHDGAIRIVAYRKLPAQYEYPYWEFKYELLR